MGIQNAPRRLRLVLLSASLSALIGCTRAHYRRHADRETYAILHQMNWNCPWKPPPGFCVQPDPRSRFFDPTSIDDPRLPYPAPQLYAYDMPGLPSGGEAPRENQEPGEDPSSPNNRGAEPNSEEEQDRRGKEDQPDQLRQPNEFDQPPSPADQSRRIRPRWDGPPQRIDRQVRPAFYGASLRQPPGGFDDKPEPLPPPDDAADVPETEPLPETEQEDENGIRIVALPESTWEDVSPACRRRMLEFSSIREEYRRTFGQPPSEQDEEQAPRLTLDDILYLALINSREYQTQKETLYRAALRLTLERFEYDYKFSPTGNRSSVDYAHNRNSGITVNNLNIPTTVMGEKLLITGGDVVTRFANNVVLTFNGPDGFAKEIGSEMLMDISQTVFQRDIVFEALTQFERDVVYAAQAFARFRKAFFAGLAQQYYGLLLNYRQIEIDSQNYFTLARSFYEAEAEFRFGQRSRVQVDQVEQNLLNGRSRVLQSCNSLEVSLDNLKLQIGLPTETPVNLRLTELESLTLRDEITVAAELVRRAQRQLRREVSVRTPQRDSLLNAAVVTIRRMLTLAELQRRREDNQQQDQPGFTEGTPSEGTPSEGMLSEGAPGDRPPGAESTDEGGESEQDNQLNELRTLLARLEAQEARATVRFNQAELALEQRAESPSPTRIFYRMIGLSESMLRLVRRQTELARLLSAREITIAQLQRGRILLTRRANRLRDELERAVATSQLDRVDVLVEQADTLLRESDLLVQKGDRLLEYQPTPPAQRIEQTIQQANRLIQQAGQTLSGDTSGLTPVEVNMDDVMLTALVQRFDLMTQRGQLADSWRQIKLAGDDLRSVLNLRATQTIRTPREFNRPFAFSFDDSQTRLTMTWDTPLNRRAQRNAYRASLINYNQSLRNLIGAEDNIKFSVRNDLRDLSLGREQYQIAVASAGLAYERVISTQLQLQLGIEGIVTRDFLEAQTAYASALSAVASRHINYILDRMQLFLDMESMQLDAVGFWRELYAEDYQPSLNYQLPPFPAYGKLPFVLYSHKIKRMKRIPNGVSHIWRDPPLDEENSRAPPEEIPPAGKGIQNPNLETPSSNPMFEP